jgi:hypothetical protein
MSVCPSRTHFERLLADQLTSSEEGALNAHLGSCSSCQQTLDELTALRTASGRLREPCCPPASLSQKELDILLAALPVPSQGNHPTELISTHDVQAALRASRSAPPERGQAEDQSPVRPGPETPPKGS